MADNRTGAQRIADERARQAGAEGYSDDHDDEHTDGSLAMAAACYAAPTRIFVRGLTRDGLRDPWPWSEDDDKRPVLPPTRDERIRMLEKAGALCAAEIDRLLRQAGSEGEPAQSRGARTISLNSLRGGGSCSADDDGDCTWSECPQLRDGEPARSGRHCPLDVQAGSEGEP